MTLQEVELVEFLINDGLHSLGYFLVSETFAELLAYRVLIVLLQTQLFFYYLGTHADFITQLPCKVLVVTKILDCQIIIRIEHYLLHCMRTVSMILSLALSRD